MRWRSLCWSTSSPPTHMAPQFSTASLSIQLWSRGLHSSTWCVWIWLIGKVGLAPSFCKSRIIFLLLREERIDALLETAQTQSYNTAMELGQRGIRLGHFVDVWYATGVYHFANKTRYVTGVVMEGALRAPGLMADIVQVPGAVNLITIFGEERNRLESHILRQWAIL